MRLVTFTRTGRVQREVGALSPDNAVLDLAAVEPMARGQSMLDLAAAEPALLDRLRAAVGGAPVVEDARLCAPIPRPPKNVFCVGKNYHEHAKEFAGSGFDGGAKDVVPPFPVVFSKPHTPPTAGRRREVSSMSIRVRPSRAPPSERPRRGRSSSR